ncbi:MAG: FAD-dependent oxidoreductase, partial [Planctomycetales bacterium]|nr:FAD-dependent oxidoreductase [Planctomycetales bacterium]
PTPQSIGMGSYTMDSHNVQRYIKPNGDVENEGDIGVSTRGPYQIAFGSILPKRAQCQNLLVPVCLSSSHIAFGSIRMEPVFMILGQSAATTAALALKNDIAVQDVDYDELRQQLLADGQVLEYTADELNKLGVDPTKIQGTVVDNAAAQLSGNWTPSTSGPSVGRNYLHDGNAGNGKATARFAAQLPSGRYQVRLAYSQNANRASNVPLLIEHAGGRHFIQINQRQQPPIDQLFISLGEFRFAEDSPAVVTLCNRGTNGYVIADAVQFLPLDSGVPDSASAPPVGSPRDALTAIEDQPGLPRVLLIGDSISMGYTLPVRRLLAGKANVHHPPENCGSSGRGLQRLDRWLGAKKWDVIVFNFGIHDAKLPPEGTGHATLDEYQNNLSKILQRLLETEATILWATSTPIPNGGQLAPNRRFANIDGYNHKALQVMEEYELRVIDLNAEIRPHLQSEQKPNDVHFTPAGSQRLARRVAQSILATLPAKQ